MANIPNLPGVPALLDGFSADETPPFITSDDPSISQAPATAQWGLYLNGSPVVTADNVVSFEYKQDWALSNYPIEGGAFETYDKVIEPYDVRLRFSSGGTEDNRQALLDSIAAIAGDLNLYDATTPEEAYTSVNVVHYSYERRATNGVGLIQVDVWCTQVRITAEQSFSSTKQPSAAATKNDGNVQPNTPAPGGATGSWTPGAQGSWAPSGAQGSWSTPGAQGSWQ